MFWRILWIILCLLCHTFSSWAVRFAIVEVVHINYTLTKTMDPAVLCCSYTYHLKVTVVNVDHAFSPFSEGQAEYHYSTHNSRLFVPILGKISSQETNPFPHSQNNPRNLRHPIVYRLVHKSPSPVLILSHTYPINATPSHFLKILFNIIFPLTY